MRIKIPQKKRQAFVKAGLMGIVLPLLTGVVQAQTDVTIGGDARAFGMGGAGIALSQGGALRNPAALAFQKGPFSLGWPSLGIRATGGLNYDKLYNYYKDSDKDSATATLAKQFASEDSSFGVNANLSLRIAKVEISGFAVAKGYLQPNDALKAWAASGGESDTVPFGSRADVIAAGYYVAPAIATGVTLPVSPNLPFNIAIGGKLKYMKAYYTHFYADADVLNTDNSKAIQAPEMEGKDYLDKKGVGADIGFLLNPRTEGNGISGGVVIANLIRPSFKFTGTDRFGNPKEYDLIKTTISAGVGYKKKDTTLAVDLIDIGGATGERQLRFGGEQKFGLFAVRAGYASSTGFTAGVGLFGFDIAVGKRQPLEVIKTLNF